jgi:hypothetical protein
MVFGLWGCQFFDGTMILHAACQDTAIGVHEVQNQRTES